VKMSKSSVSVFQVIQNATCRQKKNYTVTSEV
jgi:hypothetical protein